MVFLTRHLSREWSQTLRLPKTSFPARASAEELAKYRTQSTEDLYEWNKTRLHPHQRQGKLFILHDGPPYANGDLHVGHAINKILKDIICRVQVRNCKLVQYIPGWDCHGLPIELKALEKWNNGVSGGRSKEQTAVSIRRAARELASKTIFTQKKGFQEWGVMGDFKNAWHTMDKTFELDQLRVFREMVRNDLIFRRFKPVYWSPSTGTALAEAELEYKEDHVSTAAFIKFPLKKVPLAFQGIEVGPVSAAVWTTTPWTLPGNKAIAVNESMAYSIVQSSKHGNLLVAKSRIPFLQGFIGQECLRVLVDDVPGAELSRGTTYSGVLNNEELDLPVLAAEFVTPDSGTGLVHCAPGHGMDDYELCRKFGIDAFAPVDDNGNFTGEAMLGNPQLLNGKSVLDQGSTAVIDQLTGSGHVITTHKYSHKYPYDWRSKAPVIIRATKQWFADLGPIRDQALEALKDVKFIPETGRARLESFVKNRTEWCISRQRAWGVPIPALYHKDTGEALLSDWSVSHIIDEIEKHGIEAWWTDDKDAVRWTPLGLRESKDVSMYRRGFDTMDVWFDSGTSWTQVQKALLESGLKRDGQPLADVYIEGTDQHRGWFQSSLLTFIAAQLSRDPKTQPQPPFKTLITHGFTLDQSGRKMSKSLGNVISPQAIIDGTLLPPLKQKNKSRGGENRKKGNRTDILGPDVLRLWVAGCDFTKDITVGDQSLNTARSNLLKLRITFKLLLGILKDFRHDNQVKISELCTIDRIALIQLAMLNKTVLESFESFEFHKAVNAIARWASMDFSALYMESIKDRIYADAPNSHSRRSVQTVVHRILTNLQSILTPITPLLVQESHAHSQGSHRYHTGGKMLPKQVYILRENDKGLKADLPALLAAKTAVNAAQEHARNQKQMRSSLECFVHLGLPDSTALGFYRGYEDTLEPLFVVSAVSIAGSIAKPKNVEEAPWHQKMEFEAPGGGRGMAYVYTPAAVKCARCWRYKVEDISAEIAAEDRLCGRCEEVVKELDEQTTREETEVAKAESTASG